MEIGVFGVLGERLFTMGLGVAGVGIFAGIVGVLVFIGSESCKKEKPKKKLHVLGVVQSILALALFISGVVMLAMAVPKYAQGTCFSSLPNGIYEVKAAFSHGQDSLYVVVSGKKSADPKDTTLIERCAIVAKKDTLGFPGKMVGSGEFRLIAREFEHVRPAGYVEKNYVFSRVPRSNDKELD